jgi:integrase
MTSTMLLRAILDDYAAINGITAGTKRLYTICLKHLERSLGHEPTLEDLNDLTYAKFVDWRKPNVAHETLRGDCNKLLALWRWCSTGKRRWVEPPEVKAPDPSWRLPKALDKEQLERLWEVASVYPKLVGTLPGNVVLTALLYTLWDTSERIGAVHQIHRENIDLKGAWLFVEPDTRKGGKEGRLYKIRPATVAALEKLLLIYEGEQPFAECALNNYYKHWPYLRSEAELPKWATPHTIRKSHASHLTRLGGDARLSLGHCTDAVTNRHYIDRRIAGDGKQPCDLLFDPGCTSEPLVTLGSLWSRLMGRAPRTAPGIS